MNTEADSTAPTMKKSLSLSAINTEGMMEPFFFFLITSSEPSDSGKYPLYMLKLSGQRLLGNTGTGIYAQC